jgi:hypothetical protein
LILKSPNEIKSFERLPEIFGSKVDSSAENINQDFLSKFHFEDPYQGSGDQQGV